MWFITIAEELYYSKNWTILLTNFWMRINSFCAVNACYYIHYNWYFYWHFGCDLIPGHSLARTLSLLSNQIAFYTVKHEPKTIEFIIWYILYIWRWDCSFIIVWFCVYKRKMLRIVCKKKRIDREGLKNICLFVHLYMS